MDGGSDREKIVRKSCGQQERHALSPHKHNGYVQFLSCENHENRLLYLVPGCLWGGLFIARGERQCGMIEGDGESR